VTSGRLVADGEPLAMGVVLDADVWNFRVTAGALSDLTTNEITAMSTTTEPRTTQAHHTR
jgi:hypothetical protein